MQFTAAANSAQDHTVLKANLEAVCSQILRDKNLPTFQDTVYEIIPDTHLSMVFISLGDRRIHFLEGEHFAAAMRETIGYEKLTQPPHNLSFDEAFRKAHYMLVCHEYGHHKYSPRSKELFELMINSIYDVVGPREWNVEKMTQLIGQISNMFTDTVVNAVNAATDEKKQDFRDGYNILYLTAQGFSQRKKLGGADKAMSVFMNSNYFLTQQSPEMHNKISHYFKKLFPSLPRYTRKVLNIMLGDSQLVDKVLEHKVTPQMEESIVARLMDTSQWGAKSKAYAEVMYPLMRSIYSELENSFTRKDPKQGNSGSPKEQPPQKAPPKPQKQKEQKPGKEGSPDEKKQQEKKQDGKKEGEGSGQKKEEKDKKQDDQKNGCAADGQKDKEKSTAGKYDSKLDEAIRRRLLNDKQLHTPYSSSFLRDYGSLNTHYEKLADRFRILMEDLDKQAPNYDVLPGREKMPLSEFSRKNIDWASTKVIKRDDGTSQVELYRKVCPITLPIPKEEGPGGIWDISFIFDSSSSMGFDPYHNRGDYHFCCLGVYAILKDLEERGLAPFVNYHAMNFSNQTISSGWQPYSNIEKIKRTLFDYQGWGTALDVDKLRELKTRRLDNFLNLMFTDYGFNTVENAQEVTEEIINMTNGGGIGFLLFQMYGHNELTQKLEKNGVPVIIVNSGEDFMNKSFKFAKDFYGGLSK